MSTNSAENIQNNKEAKNAREGGVFSSIYIFHRFDRTTTAKIPRHDDNKKKEKCSIWERRKEKYCYKDTQDYCVIAKRSHHS